MALLFDCFGNPIKKPVGFDTLYQFDRDCIEEAESRITAIGPNASYYSETLDEWLDKENGDVRS